MRRRKRKPLTLEERAERWVRKQYRLKHFPDSEAICRKHEPEWRNLGRSAWIKIARAAYYGHGWLNASEEHFAGCMVDLFTEEGLSRPESAAQAAWLAGRTNWHGDEGDDDDDDYGD